MQRQVVRLLVPAMLVFCALSARAAEPDNKSKKPLGTWERKVGDNVVKFDIKADTFQMTIKTGNATIELDASYGVTKDGTLFGIVTKGMDVVDKIKAVSTTSKMGFKDVPEQDVVIKSVKVAKEEKK